MVPNRFILHGCFHRSKSFVAREFALYISIGQYPIGIFHKNHPPEIVKLSQLKIVHFSRHWGLLETRTPAMHVLDIEFPDEGRTASWYRVPCVTPAS
jgi:hypothetical protein